MEKNKKAGSMILGVAFVWFTTHFRCTDLQLLCKIWSLEPFHAVSGDGL